MKLVYTEQALQSLEEALELIISKVSHERLINFIYSLVMCNFYLQKI
jgi:hypothetical protein